MQRIFNSLLGLSLVFMVIFSAGCDGTGNGNGTDALGPTLTLAAGDDLVSTDASVPFATGSFTVRIDVNDGDNTLNTLTITEDGNTIPATNLEFDNGNTTAQNPFLILGAAQSGTTYDVKVTPSSLTANETRTYAFTVTDSNNKTATQSVSVTFAATPPTVTFGAGGLQADANISTRTAPFSIQVVGSSTESQIASVAFYENDVLLPADSVRFGNDEPLTTNPELITPNVANFDRTYTIHPVSPAAGARTYRVELTDAFGGVSSQSITITFFTPTVESIEGILFNAGGPEGTGGLDLDNGQGTGSNDPAAELKDEGIDLSAPTNAENWKQQIRAINNAELRALTPGNMPDGFNFNTVSTLEEVIAAFNAAQQITVSEEVSVGDMFAIKRGNNYYLMLVTEVNVTENDNGDNYVVSIIK